MQKTTTKLFCLILGIAFILSTTHDSLSAQNKFEKATIQLMDGTEQSGLIRGNDLSIFSRLIAFKNHKKDKQIQVLKPENIHGFTTNNDQKFRSLAVDFQIITDGGRAYTYNANRFVHVLQEGKISVYELRDFDVRAYFIQKEGQPAELLTLNRKLTTAEVSKFTNLLADCNCIEYDEALPTRINDVILTAEEYNESMASPVNEATVAVDGKTDLKKP